MKEEKKKNPKSKSSLSKRFYELTNLFDHKNKDISRLRIQLKERDVQTLSSMKSLVEQIAETEEHLSYIIIEEYGRILASTPTFREIFHYNNPDKPIKGRPCYSALKIPLDSPDYIHNLEQVLGNPERLKKQTTIYNGKGEEVIVKFTKYEPTNVVIGDKNFSFTRIDIYEIGGVRRIGEIIIRKLHPFNGDDNTLHKLITKNINAKSKLRAEKEKKDILEGKYETQTKVIAVSGIAWKDKTDKEKRNAAKVRLKEIKKTKKKK